MKTSFFVSLFLVVVFVGLGAETISVRTAFVQAASPVTRRGFEDALETAIAAADRASARHGYRINARSNFQIEVTAYEDAEDRYITVSGGDVTRLLRNPWDETLAAVLVQTFRYFEPVFFGYPEYRPETVEFVDEFPLEFVRPPSTTYQMLGLYPMGLGMLPDGSVLVAGSTFAIALDPLFRIRSYPGVELLDDGVINYSRAIGATPAGTIVMQPAQGNDLYRLLPGTTRPQRVRLGVGGFGPLVVLPDSSIVTIDTIAKRAVRIVGRDRFELPLFSHPDAYIAAATAGPAGNIWVFDGVEQRISIFNPDGRLVDSIVPAIPMMAASQTVGIAPFEDGSFVMLTRVGIWRVSRDGQPLWVVPTLADGRDSTLQQAAAVAVDSDRGFIYIADSSRRVLVRLRDTGFDTGSTEISSRHDELADIYRRIARTGESEALLIEKARVYTETGAALLAEATWEFVLDLDPFNDEAQDQLEEAAFRRLVAQAARADGDTRYALSRLGPASARESYLRAQQLYEEILAIRPREESIARQKDSLTELFRSEEVPSDAPNPLIIEDVVLENVFPSLIATYRRRPIGTVTVTNDGDTPLESIQAEIELRRYTDFPTVNLLDRPIAPGASADIALNLVLNTIVFEVEEDLPVQASIRVTGRGATGEVVQRHTETVTLHRRTALTWDETERLAAFITPNENNVSQFSFSAVTAVQDELVVGFPRPFTRVARIVDTLALYGISYVADPRTPISAILGDSAVVDTVRVPRTTLLNRAGDCDDTSALVASLLEAAGIATAIVTTPDHVLIAFDTGEPASNAWIYESAGYVVVAREDTLWMPLETTVLREGFVETLEAATRRIDAAGGVDGIGFIETGRARARYAPIPVPPTDLGLVLPSPDAIREQSTTTARGLSDAIYAAALSATERQTGNATRRTEVARLSRLGSLHARFGRAREAEASFSEALDVAPTSALARVHYASFLLAEQRPVEAIEVLEPAHRRLPDVSLIRALLARSYLDAGRSREAREHIGFVNENAPDLAARYAIQGSGSGTRASDEYDPARAVLPESENLLQ